MDPTLATNFKPIVEDTNAVKDTSTSSVVSDSPPISNIDTDEEAPTPRQGTSMEEYEFPKHRLPTKMKGRLFRLYHMSLTFQMSPRFRLSLSLVDHFLHAPISIYGSLKWPTILSVKTVATRS